MLLSFLCPGVCVSMSSSVLNVAQTGRMSQPEVQAQQLRVLTPWAPQLPWPPTSEPQGATGSEATRPSAALASVQL